MMSTVTIYQKEPIVPILALEVGAGAFSFMNYKDLAMGEIFRQIFVRYLLDKVSTFMFGQRIQGDIVSQRSFAAR